ncbi:TerC family protein [Kallotenue papyrolyticum]|uniref:TerC family protein n=1 Tax=Kallotenue papyrolyticum TaxID=1325125 RepID=UPI0004B60A3C|nr:TerC family protein [Kallotenue papyrolyticum]
MLDAAHLGLWIGFGIAVIGMLTLDLGVFHRQAHTVSLKEAAIWSAVWIALALVFNVFVWIFLGQQAALEFLTGYLIEKSLSVDNIFVFVLIFSYFSVPSKYQHRVLFWGIIGAIVMRAILILLGVELIERFHWIIYIFGAFLIFTGARMAFHKDDQELHPEDNPLIKLFRRFMPVVPEYHGQKFFVRHAGKLAATPLFIVLLMVESTDLIFAVDSIPAILGISRDPFIVFTSNIFAILGLRALYFLLAGVVEKFRYLKYGLSAVLVFIGFKMVIEGFYKIPVTWSLGVVATVLTISIAASLWQARREEQAAQTAQRSSIHPAQQ